MVKFKALFIWNRGERNSPSLNLDIQIVYVYHLHLLWGRIVFFKDKLFNPSNARVALRKQSIDLHNKSIDWFLYEGNTGI